MFAKHYQNLVYGRVDEDNKASQQKQILYQCMSADQVSRVKFFGQGSVFSLATTELYTVILSKTTASKQKKNNPQTIPGICSAFW